MSSRAIKEGYLIYNALTNQEVSGDETSNWVPMHNIRRVLAIMEGGAAAAAGTFKITMRKAKTAAGGDAADVSVGDAKREATGTANTKVKELTIDVEHTNNDDTLVVNGVTYTKVENSATGNQYTNAAGLKTLLDARDGMGADDNAHVVTVTADPGHTVTAAVGSVDEGTTTIATTRSLVAVEVLDEELGEGFDYLAAKVDPSGAGNYSVVFLMESKNLPVSQGELAAEFPT